ncbi:LLM class flavin-dependent oxidoreductase [Streptosporangium saharense]|uniref:Alkanesulfonate monooxygenase n=1 Tax=Streptosporangium saharense TaxID=1706840 RepID=A0A7W7QSW9_9ACTN|nr:LLM class flavin-dependent oxidoreductase [Streptosporangium saharense]MBB4919180.1 alkanesulfonate monooxygenase [Streptosporangium saharense]
MTVPPAQLLWYLTAPDGPYPWEERGRWATDFDHLRHVAETIDRLGYYGALLGTGRDDGLTVAAAMAGATRRMRFLTAVYPGLASPAKLAQIAHTIDRFSGGRLLFNVVNGNDATLAQYGLHLGHDERYDFSAEYWDAFQRVYLGEPEPYEGSHVRLAGRGGADGPLSPWGSAVRPTPLWGAGTSPAGVAHSAGLLDVYLSFADTPRRLGEKFRRVGAEAAKLGRTLRYGTRLQIIVRETEEEAWEHAASLLRATSVETALELAKWNLPEPIETYRSQDPLVNRRLEALRSGRLPDVRDLEIYPNVWTGPSLFGFDVVSPSSGTYLVGSAENVAARIREYQEHGVQSFILSGFPLIAEAHRVADLLFPLLDLDHGFEIPSLRAGA